MIMLHYMAVWKDFSNVIKVPSQGDLVNQKGDYLVWVRPFKEGLGFTWAQRLGTVETLSADGSEEANFLDFRSCKEMNSVNKHRNLDEDPEP